MAQAIVQAMTNDLSLPNRDPPLATVSAAIAALQTVQGAAQARNVRAVARRNGKRKAVVTLFEWIKATIEKVAAASRGWSRDPTWGEPEDSLTDKARLR